MSNNSSTRVVIWDLPTRIFHWLLLSSFLIAWLTYEDNRFLFVHVYGGYVFFSLLVFRFIWGVVGSHHARFHTFAHDWDSVSEYLKGLLTGQATRYIGHNPIGGWAIFLMLALGVIISVTGMLTLGGEEGHGPLRGLVSFGVGIKSHEIHEILAWVMLGMIAVHLAGVFVESLYHKENLIWSMITGRKETAAGELSVRGHHLLGLSIVAIVFVSAFYYFHGYLVETADNLYQPYRGPDLPTNALWIDECGDCHFAFHPSLLPKRSWKKIFETQHDHFGEDLDLDQETVQKLLAFHLKYAAESELSEPARRILYDTPPNETPLRITETHYWVKKHGDIKDVYWKSEKVRTKSNCPACHLDAKRGTYEDSDMRLPDLN